jgi:ATP-binding protein involved in chromosome partitioning
MLRPNPSRIIEAMSSPLPPRPGQQQQPLSPQPLPGVGAIIAVGSGKGGVGKTTLAVNLAIVLSKLGHKVGLLDADVYGPNVPLMLGISAQPKVLGDNRIEPLEAHGLKVISVGFLNPGDKPLIWRGPMLHSIIKQFLGSVVWGELDYLVVDLPPGTGDVALSLIQTVPLTGAIVVSTPSDVSLQDARKAIEMFRQMKVDLVGMVENMSYFVCPHCNHQTDIFSRGGAEKTAQQFGVSYLGEVQLDPDIRKASDSGRPTVLNGEGTASGKSLFDFARKVVTRVDEIKANAGESVIQIQ